MSDVNETTPTPVVSPFGGSNNTTSVNNNTSSNTPGSNFPVPRQSPTPSPTPSDNETTLEPPDDSTTPEPSETTSKSHAGLYSGVAAAIVVFAVVLFFALRRLRARKTKKDSSSTTHSSATTTTTAVTSGLLHWRCLPSIRVDIDAIQLTKPLASGAFGTIYLGKYKNQVVAVKTCTKAAVEDVQHFIDELDLMASLSSPFVVALLGVAWTKATDLQAILEYMNMGDVRDLLTAKSAALLTWQTKLECALSVAKALVYLKERSVIHRDLKSRNILVDSAKGTKLADFGIARHDTAETMTTGVGTYRWMAPEVLAFRHYTIAVDVFSFGVVLTELETHAIPYADIQTKAAASDAAIVVQVLKQKLRPSLTSACPPWLYALAHRCMDEDPQMRPDPTELVHILQDQLNQQTDPSYSFSVISLAS
ncbi:unnamed protein product [Aphanomyces euteiches]|uniref:Protein kinase domain-containing protein n=1 Tax=Aphanomyces euteiches TaxID=100861 RepID=A0A6G0WFR3_9STRA|nr:hypothetical protein Ae201684_016231 [Aphanomyces euteiches]KAH9095248.1 hypothetical protein Ae201684P_013364 [Aphanomyces euteiches]KAH9153506.1 hypothetical protein AeRB84_004252 [Aphanomyces euteiches]